MRAHAAEGVADPAELNAVVWGHPDPRGVIGSLGTATQRRRVLVLSRPLHDQAQGVDFWGLRKPRVRVLGEMR